MEENKKQLYYKSTRGDREKVTASQAILRGLAPDGGLYVPEEIPPLPYTMEQFGKMDYQETAYAVLRAFLTDFTEEELRGCVEKAYDDKFDTSQIAPLVKIGKEYYLELFHGATIAFKDMALSILPHLMTVSAEKQQVEEEILILAATSGDTGKAAMAGFADVEGTRIIVFYPKNGVSKVQELQMVTQKGANVDVVALHGNFDHAQSGVKALFEDRRMAEELKKKGYRFSSANSINIGRLLPQVVYYVYACAKLLENQEIQPGETLDVVVPTGNFGNILAAYYAKWMGAPIGRLICASNENKVLYDFFETGCYDKNREFILTTSPSMDILISSNLERLLYHASLEDAEAVRACMEELKEKGSYRISDTMRKNLREFQGGYATEEETAAEIRRVYEATGYVMDTHTAVASAVCGRYREEEQSPCLIASTASPYKFVKSVLAALGKEEKGDELSLLYQLEKVSRTAMPKAVKEILEATVLHTMECDRDEMKETVRKILEA
ncbi:threonine synthase [Suipraeoptans intestinalis]|uniref:threonine synthase n=1 Tax=Suipraeoptans intestinalis TaxID=2606628 RepID=UPI0023F31288|nr:threonine synthase [Suipraeoptans intestinalis]MDD7770485.1 threonine synthase [Suipraeoptans intestinalis]